MIKGLLSWSWYDCWGAALALISGVVATVAFAAGPDPSLASGTNQTAYINKETYVISVGDKLSYRTVEDRDEAKTLSVSPTGEILVPYFGRVVVAGKTMGEAASEIKALLEKELYYQATVLLSIDEAASALRQNMRQVVVVGAVRSAGPQEMPPGEKYTVSRAILKAAGFSAFANGRKVKIVRKGEKGKPKEIIADVLSVLKDGKIDNDVDLMPEDMVIVPEKILNW